MAEVLFLKLVIFTNTTGTGTDADTDTSIGTSLLKSARNLLNIEG